LEVGGGTGKKSTDFSALRIWGGWGVLYWLGSPRQGGKKGWWAGFHRFGHPEVPEGGTPPTVRQRVADPMRVGGGLFTFHWFYRGFYGGGGGRFPVGPFRISFSAGVLVPRDQLPGTAGGFSSSSHQAGFSGARVFHVGPPVVPMRSGPGQGFLGRLVFAVSGAYFLRGGGHGEGGIKKKPPILDPRGPKGPGQDPGAGGRFRGSGGALGGDGGGM